MEKWTFVATLVAASAYVSSLNLNSTAADAVLVPINRAIHELKSEASGFAEWMCGNAPAAWSAAKMPANLIQNSLVLLPHGLLILGVLLLPFGVAKAKAALLTCVCGTGSLALTLSTLGNVLGTASNPATGMYLMVGSSFVLAATGFRQAWRLVSLAT